VVDHGSLAEVTIDAVEMGSTGKRERVLYEQSSVRMLRIRLVWPIEPGNQHTIHWWDRTGAFYTLAPELSKAQDDGLWWRASVPPDLTEPIAIAIAYNGTRLGSWWDDRWSTAIRRPTQQDPETIAALLYWFHLPVLSPRYLFDVRSFAAIYMGEALAAWVGKIGLPPGLQWGELDDGWLSAVRTIFWNWRPTKIPVQQLIEPLLRTSDEQDFLDALSSVVWKVLRVNPLLIGLALQQWVSEEGITTWGTQQSRALVQHLMYNIAEAQSSDDLQRNIATLEEDVARTMEIDPIFIERSLIQRAYDLLQEPSVALRRLDQDNLAIAMNVEPFRRLLGIKLIDHILQNIK
jgi:hypothetical protein